MAKGNDTDQQRRVIAALREDTAQLLTLLNRIHGHTTSYTRLGMGDDQFLSEEAFEGTGTDKAAYRGAITSLSAIDGLLAQGHGTNLERFAR